MSPKRASADLFASVATAAASVHLRLPAVKWPTASVLPSVLSAPSVRDAARVAMTGCVATHVAESERRVDVRVVLEPTGDALLDECVAALAAVGFKVPAETARQIATREGRVYEGTVVILDLLRVRKKCGAAELERAVAAVDALHERATGGR